MDHEYKECQDNDLKDPGQISVHNMELADLLRLVKDPVVDNRPTRKELTIALLQGAINNLRSLGDASEDAKEGDMYLNAPLVPCTCGNPSCDLDNIIRLSFGVILIAYQINDLDAVVLLKDTAFMVMGENPPGKRNRK
jgi:hypothetical protein